MGDESIENSEGIPVNVPDGFYTVFCGMYYVIDSVPSGLIVPQGKENFTVKTLDGLSIYNFIFYDEVPSNIDLIVVESEEIAPVVITFFLVPYVSVIDDVGSVWTDILVWFISCINVVVGIFWTGSQLTLIGTLSLVGTAIALCLLIYHKVKDYLKIQ